MYSSVSPKIWKVRGIDLEVFDALLAAEKPMSASELSCVVRHGSVKVIASLLRIYSARYAESTRAWVCWFTIWMGWVRFAVPAKVEEPEQNSPTAGLTSLDRKGAAK